MPGYLGKFYSIFQRFGAYTTVPFPVPGESDMVVSVESQAGGMVPPVLNVFNHIHTAATTQDVADKTVDLLNADLNSSLFNNGFPIHLYP